MGQAIFKIEQQKGFAAITAVMVILSIILVMIYSYSLITINFVGLSVNVLRSHQSYYVAEAGIEDAFVRFLDGDSTNDPQNGSTFPYNGTDSEILTLGSAAVAITDTPPATEVTITGDIQQRNRKLKVRFRTEPVFTYAVQTGAGGLEMHRRTKIRCYGDLPCSGETEANDQGGVYVNGSLLANGGEDASWDNKVVADSLVVGKVFVTGKVDILAGEKHEPSGDLTESFVCLGSQDGDDCGSGKRAQSIVQQVYVNDGLSVRRVALRIAYHGSPSPATLYIVKESSGNYSAKKDSTLSAGAKIFAEYKIDANFDGSPDTVGPDNPAWVYFNFNGQALSLSDNTNYWLVLQTNTINANNYWQVYYDEAPGHAGGWGGTYQSQICSSDCNFIPTVLNNNPLESGKKADFFFRFYNLGPDTYLYQHSLQVLGELHAGEAYGATVVGEGSLKNIAFVGRRFASLFWRNRSGDHRLIGDSFVQQLDVCDISGAGGEDTRNNLDYDRGFVGVPYNNQSAYICESNVRDVAGHYVTSTTPRKITSNQSAIVAGEYDIYSTSGGYSFDYDNPYGPGAVYGNNNSYTPYYFNTLAGSGDTNLGCYVYAYNQPSSATYYIMDNTNKYKGEYPYNFCYYNGTDGQGYTDKYETDEQNFKINILNTKYGITDSNEQELYLPKAPPPRNLPISDERINNWVNNIIFEATGAYDIANCQVGSAYYVSGNINFSQSQCFQGDLVINNGATLTLEKGANIYVQGNLRMIGNGTVLRMETQVPNNWDPNKVAMVIVKGVVDTQDNAKILGNFNQQMYVFVVSRSSNEGDQDPLDSNGNQPIFTEDPAAVYYKGHNDTPEVIFYVPYGTMVLPYRPLNDESNAMQVVAKKLVMERNSHIEYRLGAIDLVFPDGPATAMIIDSYEEL